GVLGIGRDITVRKHAEEALAEISLYTRNLIEVNLDPLVMISPDGRITDVNAATERVTGYSREHLIGTDFSDYFTEPDKAREGYRKVFEEGVVRDYALEIRNRDGSIRQVLYNAAVYRDDSGAAKGVVAAARDITERRHAEDTLRISHSILEAANRNSEISQMLDEIVVTIQDYTACDAVGIRLLDAEGNIPYEAYRGFSRDFYARESPLSIKADSCMCISVIRGDADPALPWFTDFGSLYLNATSKFHSTVSEDEKGRTRNICNQSGYESVSLIPIRRGAQIIGLIHLADHHENRVPIETVRVLENISESLVTAIERKQAEAALRESEQKYRTLMASIPDKIFVKDASLAYISCNEPYARDLGIAADAILHKTDLDFYPADLAEKYRSDDRAIMQSGYSSRIEERYMIQGKEFWISTLKTPLRNNAGKVTGILGIFHDITRRRQ
ncbi:MAG: PAS domain S-box protein, partial [Methanoregula sp.]|nr:PAS domain S-box protein [Methanoregula sp.]